MTHDRSAALALLREELKRPPFHEVLRPQALDADPSTGTVVIALDYRDEFARAPNSAVAVKIGKMAPTIDLRIDYLRASAGENLIARARLLKVGSMVARVDIDITDTQGRLIAVGRGSFSTHITECIFAGKTG